MKTKLEQNFFLWTMLKEYVFVYLGLFIYTRDIHIFQYYSFASGWLKTVHVALVVNCDQRGGANEHTFVLVVWRYANWLRHLAAATGNCQTVAATTAMLTTLTTLLEVDQPKPAIWRRSSVCPEAPGCLACTCDYTTLTLLSVGRQPPASTLGTGAWVAPPILVFNQRTVGGGHIGTCSSLVHISVNFATMLYFRRL